MNGLDLLDPVGLLLAEAGSSLWFPEAASTTAHDVDWLFYFILGLSILFFIGIVGAMGYFIYKYRRRPGYVQGQSVHHNLAMEITWSVIPFLLVLYIFYMGFVGYLDMTIRPASAYEIGVTGQKWKWLFTYPNGHVDENLHVPGDRATQLVMTSEDVIHSLYIPNFRLKMDTVPGRYTRMWFEPTKPGDYELFCTEYCGTAHSNMIARVVVHPPGEFEKWLEAAAAEALNASPAEAGARLYQTRGCAQCHSVDGKAGTGPTFLGIFGKSHAMRDGSSVVVDENYIRESILEPQAKVVAGFNPVMPTYQGRLTDREIGALIEYIKTLQ